jgi:hypothetical protein
MYAKVKIEFKVNKGLRQGDASASLLFNVVMDIPIRSSKAETKGTIFDKCSQIIAYANDVVTMGRRLQDVKEVLISLIEQTKKMGFRREGGGGGERRDR